MQARKVMWSATPLLLGMLLGPPIPTLAAQELPTVKFSGELRLRGEWDGRTVGASDDAATLSRIRLGARVALNGWLGAFAQLQDARAWGTETNTLTDASADRLDLHQGYAEIGTVDRVLGRLGRQEIALGDERLVGAVGWANTGQAFDGARMLGRAGGVDWNVFWMNVAERDSLLATGPNPQLNQGVGDDGWLIGGFASRKFSGATAEFTVLVVRKAVTEESYTTNFRLHGAAGAFLYEGAGAYQFGPSRSAYFASGKVGLGVGQGSLAAQVDYLSGDDDPTAGDVKAFNTLYATNHKFYGYMDYFLNLPGQLDQAGLMDAMLRGSLTLSSKTRVRADLHHFRLARERANARGLGTEIDLVGNWTMAQYAGLEIGGGLYLPADLVTTLLPAFADGSDATYWGYAQLTLRWP
ncbi:MAG: alginate export family protein [Gemmatimonadota bacterium]|nr:alginate export family protein [Gemmatimonadota bacterium]MDH5197920.1 alginate export family protein [Gemmatimonadota bacterium]